ncbi:MAG: hypothetical protein F6J90_27735 [Moorea sp. SIOASIH]|uniref:hypothetical protein n=1 Tax=Moorena sp. SIOASIH TaxID=2607817 RepID=UPI0013B67A5D|nr:hypothetical protein [Moorena sp. SIOASIH]NEO39920.1 hypothetical protein [Moorena sp. SIOASIH]
MIQVAKAVLVSYCLLPIAYCLPLLGGVRGGFLLPIAYCLPLLGGVRGGFLLPLASCLLPIAFPSWEGLGVGSSCLLPLASCLLPSAIANS